MTSYVIIGTTVTIKDAKSKLNNFTGVVKDIKYSLLGFSNLYLVETTEGKEWFNKGEMECVRK